MIVYWISVALRDIFSRRLTPSARQNAGRERPEVPDILWTGYIKWRLTLRLGDSILLVLDENTGTAASCVGSSPLRRIGLSRRREQQLAHF
jgi:hypothetical protein